MLIREMGPLAYIDHQDLVSILAKIVEIKIRPFPMHALNLIRYGDIYIINEL